MIRTRSSNEVRGLKRTNSAARTGPIWMINSRASAGAEFMSTWSTPHALVEAVGARVGVIVLVGDVVAIGVAARMEVGGGDGLAVAVGTGSSVAVGEGAGMWVGVVWRTRVELGSGVSVGAEAGLGSTVGISTGVENGILFDLPEGGTVVAALGTAVSFGG